MYEKVAREREAGGLGLINIAERIKAIKARDLIEIEEEIIVLRTGNQTTHCSWKNINGTKSGNNEKRS